MQQVNEIIMRISDPSECATALAHYYRRIPRDQFEQLQEAYQAIADWAAQLKDSPTLDVVKKRVTYCQLIRQYYLGDILGMYKEAQGFVSGQHLMEDMLFVAHIHRVMAHICYILNLVDLAIHHTFRALRRSEACQDEEEIIKCLIQFGIIYSLVEDRELQKQYFTEAIHRARRAKLEELERNALSNLTFLHIQMNEVDQAKETIVQAERLENPNATITMLGVELNHLRLALIEKQSDHAKQCIEKIASMKALTKDKALMMDFQFLLSEYQQLIGEPIEASIQTLKKGLEISLEIGSKKYTQRFYDAIGKCYASVGHFKDAYQSQQQAIGLDMAIDRDRLNHQYLVLRVQHEVENIHQEVAQLKDQAHNLATELELAKYAIKGTQEASIYALATLAEYRDQVTGQHILRMVKYVEVLCELMRSENVYADRLTEDFVRDLSKSSSLHDIGKVGIADAILNKPGKLTPEEFEIIKTHTRIGRDALSIAEKILGHDTFLSLAMSIAYYHHEKWDGSGYPHGLSGDAIPLEARVVALLDVYDALISERPYKRAYTHQEAVAIITEGSGSHFDPHIAALFLQSAERFYEIHHNFGD